MYPDPKYITQIGSGSLHIMSMPAGGEFLLDDLRHLAQGGHTHIVSLLEYAESRELGLEREGGICDELGICFESFPVPDRGTPMEHRSFFSLVRRTHDAIQQGASCIAHCRAGIGRSGTFTCAVLVVAGYDVGDALNLVSEARGFPIPDTQSQIDWLYEYSSEISRGY